MAKDSREALGDPWPLWGTQGVLGDPKGDPGSLFFEPLGGAHSLLFAMSCVFYILNFNNSTM